MSGAGRVLPWRFRQLRQTLGSSAAGPEAASADPGSDAASSSQLDTTANAGVAPAPAQAALAGNGCNRGFNVLLSGLQLAQSQLSPNLWYFLGNSSVTDAEVGFCMADLVGCTASCLNVVRFWSATNTNVAAMCELAGLA